MKRLITITLQLSFLFSFSQSNQLVKEELRISIYGNKNQQKLINHDKSFVNEDRIFYENIDSIEKYNSYQNHDKKLVETTLQNYIEGSSYSKLELLESAFAENATLYLTVRSEFKRLTPKEYISFFKNRELGKFNGRDGKILEIQISKDIASAKVEISIPARKMIYIDLFLLKKIEKGWKIISKTATRVDKSN